MKCSKKAIDLLRREHSRRLIHDENLSAAIQHLEDFNALLLAYRQLPDLGPRINLQAKPVCQRCNFLVIFAQAHQKPRLIQAKQDILGHGLRRYEHEMLMHHADARLDGIPWRIEVHRKSVDLDGPGILTIQAGQHVHEGAFAGTVLAQKTMDLAFSDFKVDVIVREHTGESLHDSPHFDYESRF